jgi:hypothetical protein
MELMAKKTVYCERNTVLTVKKADRMADTGLYRLRLTCEGGRSGAALHSLPYSPTLVALKRLDL